MINWGTFMMEVSKTPSVLIGLVFTAITICLTIFNLWWSMRNRVEAEWTVSVTSTADVMIDPIPVAQVQAAGSRILKSNTTMVVIVTNSGDGPAFSVTAEGINMKGIVVNEYDFSRTAVQAAGGAAEDQQGDAGRAFLRRPGHDEHCFVM